MDDELDNKTISGLLGLFAHDLRNPLSALHSNIGFLSGMLPEGDTDAHDAMQDALVSCDGLVTLIDNLELLSQALAGATRRATEPVGVAGVMGEVLQLNRALAESHGSELVWDKALLSSPLTVRVHRDMYRRALNNLVRNAIQHAAGTPVGLSCEQRSSEVVVRIEDGGARLADELRDTAFSARGQLAVKGRFEGRYGRGLGLFCARYSAELAGARVAAEPTASANVFVLVAPVAA